MMMYTSVVLLLLLWQSPVLVYGTNYTKGNYDDTSRGWKYQGFQWRRYRAIRGAYKGTLHISNTIRNTATFVYQGSGFILSYRSCSICGYIDIYMDGNYRTSINQYSIQPIYKKSPVMAPIRSISNNNNNTHVVTIRHRSGSNVTIDRIEIVGYGCSMFPADNIWNTKVDTLPVHSRSSSWINSIGRYTGFHMDFGSGNCQGGPIGIPYNVIGGSTQQSITKYSVNFYYPDESDPGPYPLPVDVKREYGSDHHILLLDVDVCVLYEIYDASYDSNTDTWSGGSGAIFNVSSQSLRPNGWTSADAAGLPLLPGLVLYEEILAGEINHALRFTASSTNSYIWPARHLTSGTPNVVTNTPPMGARFRLTSSFDISSYPPAMQVILTAMKVYGIILADNGSDWFISGAPDSRWDNDMLHLLDKVIGNNLEAVDVTSLIINTNSGQCKTL